MRENEFIFASAKEWHYPMLMDAQKEILGKWTWVLSPESLNDICQKASPCYILFFHWNWFVLRNIWERHECACFHIIDVSYGRGGSPLQNLILAGHASSQVSALRMTGEMDVGPVYAKKPFTLDGSAQEIYSRARKSSADLMRWIILTRPAPVPQQGDVTLFKRRTPEQSCIPKAGSLSALYDFIRMLDADRYPHAFLEYGDYRLELRRARQESTSCFVAEVKIRLHSKAMQTCTLQ